jgi:hypothetical protein
MDVYQLLARRHRPEPAAVLPDVVRPGPTPGPMTGITEARESTVEERAGALLGATRTAVRAASASSRSPARLCTGPGPRRRPGSTRAPESCHRRAPPVCPTSTRRCATAEVWSRDYAADMDRVGRGPATARRPGRASKGIRRRYPCCGDPPSPNPAQPGRIPRFLRPGGTGLPACGAPAIPSARLAANSRDLGVASICAREFCPSHRNAYADARRVTGAVVATRCRSRRGGRRTRRWLCR